LTNFDTFEVVGAAANEGRCFLKVKEGATARGAGDVFGFGGSLFVIGAFVIIWYLVVTWNEETNKFIVEM